MINNSNKTISLGKRSHKPEFILLIGVLIMQVAIFIAIIHSRKPNTSKNAQIDIHALPAIEAEKQPPPEANKEISPFTVMEHEMAHLMNTLLQNHRQPDSRSRQQQKHMMNTINNAMQEMAFFSDMMNIDSGWDMVNISPAMDMRERENSYEIMVSIPCGTESNVIVELNGQLLNMYIPVQITTPGYKEFRTYKQQILIPGPISTNSSITATISNNILRVILPKGNRNSIHKGHTKLL